jgi:heme-degrading monooxygenase HmoA
MNLPVRPMLTSQALPLASAPRVIVVEYDSLDKAQAWWNSQATKDAFAIGKNTRTSANLPSKGSHRRRDIYNLRETA